MKTIVFILSGLIFGLTSALPPAVDVRDSIDPSSAAYHLTRDASPVPQDNLPLEWHSLAERSTPPKFSTVHQYIAFAEQEKKKYPSECSETSSPEDCQLCIGAILAAWVSALYLCASQVAAGPVGTATGLVCAASATSLYWIGRIKCLGV
ncbi:hypothetical protein V499_04784 [Pseudogymnoascus sp. VKM F-103]|uniref:Uncharacterized protein n=1 Tax=Pseudogymnoascus verrucosus TaxID=342668 RepID=A0A1B8GKE6_9PEZI|nr:uncharacterized protein VE01_05747 [Pseudogymnoascus verrucosus]KFY75226.1 hypothetical protein V499_04784 [Pseudogymnoascus sp. VKM F-103]OBT96317.1 hypothetical protein VE01_05747 [Pseudogymnoascus verrucosus]